jgi:hypothetical protein
MEDRERKKRELLVRVSRALLELFQPESSIEVVVVVSTVDGEFVGVSSNVGVDRVESILLAAAIREDHVDHPELADVEGINEGGS